VEPYYSDERTTLYHGDCLKIMPELMASSVDLVVTDPPYGISWKGTREDAKEMANDDGSLDIDGAIRAFCRLLRNGRHLYVFGYARRNLAADLPLGGGAELVWDKVLPSPGSPLWAKQHEPILFASYCSSRSNIEKKGYGVGSARLRKGSVLRVQRLHSAQTRRHPTEKPVGLLRILIESSSTFGETVFDPFAGSGSTLVAAALEGRKSIGIELSEEFCEVAAERCRNVNAWLTEGGL
jgi:site-specific DNA-methyltransferase (adenine-specific)